MTSGKKRWLGKENISLVVLDRSYAKSTVEVFFAKQQLNFSQLLTAFEDSNLNLANIKKMSTLMLIPILFTCFFNLITAAPDAKVAIRGRYPVDEAIEQRAACNADNVLRALRANSVAATHFCSDYIHIPVVTVLKSVPSVTATTQVTIFPMAIRKFHPWWFRFSAHVAHTAPFSFSQIDSNRHEYRF